MGPGVSWDALRVFVAVLRSGSFSAAADELGLAQSSVSGQVARLEKTLGHRLLDRSPSGVRATDRGRELAARIGDAVDAMAVAAGESGADDGGTRTVFVGGPAEFLSELVLPALPARLPDGLRIAARFGLAEGLVEDLRAGTIEVMVSALPARGVDLSVEPIYDEEFLLVAHPQWAEQAATDLETVPVLSYGPELPIVRRYWRSVFERRPTGLTTAVIAPDLRALLRLAVEGVGMTVLPDYLVRDALASGALVQLHEPEVAPLNTLYVATRQRPTTPDAAVDAVRDAVIQVARQLG